MHNAINLIPFLDVLATILLFVVGIAFIVIFIGWGIGEMRKTLVPISKKNRVKEQPASKDKSTVLDVMDNITDLLEIFGGD